MSSMKDYEDFLREERAEIQEELDGTREAEGMCRERHPLHYAAAPGACPECTKATR